MDLSTIVQINISLGTVTPSQANFGTPLCLGYHTRFADRFRDYTSLQGMLADGFTVNDQVYKLAASAFSQSPRPPSVRVGRINTPATPFSASLDLTGMVVSQSVQFDLVKPDGSVVEVDVPWALSASAVATAVAALDGTMTAVGNLVNFTATSNGPRLFVENITGFGDYTDITGDWGYDTAAGLCLDADPQFYGVFIDVNSPANITDMAAWALANKRLFGASPQFTDPAGYTATANALRLATNDRAFSLITKDDPSGYGACGWASSMFTLKPGSEAWAYKGVLGLEADAWTASNLTTLNTDNTNYYVTTNNVPFTFPGKMHSGEWIDIIRGIDWFEARLAERLFSLQLNNSKIPYTDAGISMIGNELRGQLAEAVNAGLFDSDWTVNLPKALSANPTDRANRVLRDVFFEARLQGAIATLVIQGTVTA